MQLWYTTGRGGFPGPRRYRVLSLEKLMVAERGNTP